MNHSWVSSSVCSHPPNNAIFAGLDTDKSPLYVARGMYGSAPTPAKAISCKKSCYISYGGKVISVPNFEYLVGSGFQWVAASNGHIPAEAVVGGNDPSGEVLYIGRTNHLGSLQPGKIHRTYGCIFIAYGVEEIRYNQYEVLVQIRQKSHWVPCGAYSPAPNGAVLAGKDSDGSDIYVGRAQHERDQLVAKVIPNKNYTAVSYNGQEFQKNNFEVLCHGNVQWVHSCNGQIVRNAVRGGVTECGEVLYIGRGPHCGSLTVGKIYPSHGCLYIPFGHEEISLKNYEILIEN